MPRLRGALRKSFLERNQRIIGLIALALLVGGSAMALLLTGGVFASRYTVTAYFTDAAGIQPGDAVTVAGLPAGIVKGLHVDGGRVAMDLGINTSVKMPTDSSAEWRISCRGPLGPPTAIGRSSSRPLPASCSFSRALSSS